MDEVLSQIGIECVAEVTPSREPNTVAVWTDEMCHEELRDSLSQNGLPPKSVYTTQWIVSQWDDDADTFVDYDERVLAIEF